MDQLGTASLWTFLDGSATIQKANVSLIRRDKGHHVGSYLELTARVAELQFRNRDYVLLFRGQPFDHAINDSTTLRPKIFRPLAGKKTIRLSNLEKRYDALNSAEQLLIDEFQSLKRLGRQRVARQRLLRWAILQHYEVCETPLLDVSQSLRIAASFASLGDPREAYLFVLAVPNLSGAVTASAEAGVQIVRLASVCPPAAIRAHIQEGYLLGEYPDFSSLGQTRYYKPYQLDFARRLIGKFRFNPASFWSDPTFPQVKQSALYPASKDWLEAAVLKIQAKIAS